MTHAKFDSLDFIMKYEDLDFIMKHEDVIDGFQCLIDSGMVWSLQGSYGRMASALLESGECRRKAVIDPAEVVGFLRCPQCGDCPREDGVSEKGELDCFDVIGAEPGCLFCQQCHCQFSVSTGKEVEASESAAIDDEIKRASCCHSFARETIAGKKDKINAQLSVKTGRKVDEV